MDVFVENVIRTDKVICDNIDNKDVLGEELLAQNIVAQLRHFVEGIARLICSREQNIANNQKGTEKAIKLVKSRENLLFLRRFHQSLQVSSAHSTVDPDAAKRLMYRYWDYLQDCKLFLKQEFNIDVLHNIDEFPVEEDQTLKEYYEKIMHTKWLVIILIIGIALLFLPDISQSEKEKEQTHSESFITNISEYEKNLEKKLSETLATIDGVGNVSVMITFADYGKYTYSQEKQEEKSETTSKENQKTILKNSSSGGEEPVLIKAELPKITGVLITAEGAHDSAIKENITDAVKAVLNIGTKNISVLSK